MHQNQLAQQFHKPQCNTVSYKMQCKYVLQMTQQVEVKKIVEVKKMGDVNKTIWVYGTHQTADKIWVLKIPSGSRKWLSQLCLRVQRKETAT